MTVRTIIISVGIAIALVVQIGCVESGPSGAATSLDDLKVVATANAAVELNNRKAAGKSAWAIVCNGTCMGAPALAFFEGSEAADDSVSVEVLDGVEFIVERKAVALVDKWGLIVVRCQHPGSRELVVEFAKTQSPQ